MPSPLSDVELVARFKEGDRDAYGQIVQRYQDRVFTMAFRWMGDRQIAEEVAQDVFLALFRSLGRFRGESLLSTWIYRVVANHCKNRRMYQYRRHHDKHDALQGTSNTEDAPFRQLPDPGPGTDAPLQTAQAGQQVQQALGKLDEEQRHIIVLRDIQDLSYDEISEILDLPRGTVKSRLHRARAKLARVLFRTLQRDDVL